MLPPGVCEEELSDWLGFQRESAAVWLDGACRQWGKRLSRVSPALKNAAQEGDTITCCHAGSRLTVSRDGKAIKTFDGVPASWCFAAGAFGGQVRVMRECEEEPSLQQSRLVFSDVTVFHVPSGDMGKGRSDVYVEFALLQPDGTAAAAQSEGRPRLVTTCSLSQGGETCTFADQLQLPLPDGFVTTGGLLSITVYDDDLSSSDDALAVATMPLSFTPEAWPGDMISLDQLQMQGQPQAGTAGSRFPDSEISFTLRWKGSFH